jgi:putative ABC transport system ATP-binding protein
MIRLRGISKVFGRGNASVYALKNVDLDVHPREVLMLVGPSGSGKTTLLSIMGCILKPTSGSLRVGDREIANLPERKLPRVRLQNFGFVFQGFNLFPALTARENVEVALTLKGIGGGRRRRQAVELLESVGLAAKLNSVPADMSGGEKQRVAIARALAGDPPVLLADEPTASLDSQTGLSVMELLASVARQRAGSVVVVTHDTRLLRYADRVVHMQDGFVTDTECREPAESTA